MPLGLLEYLGTEAREEYIRGHRTPEPEPAIPSRIGFLVGEICVYLREENIEGVQGNVDEVGKKRVEGNERGDGGVRRKKRQNKKKPQKKTKE